MTPDHHKLLTEVLHSQPELQFGFVARASGELLVEAGDRSSLPYRGVVDMAMRPESIAAFYDECVEHSKTNPSMVPLVYGQGAIEGIIGIPSPAALLVVFGLIPDTLTKASSTEKVAWSSSFRRRTWSAVEEAYRNGR